MPKRRLAEKATKAPQRPPLGKKRVAAPAERGFLRARPGTQVFVLVAVHLLFAVLAFEPQLHNGGDNAAYYALARALSSGDGYREIYDPAQPIHTQYPPVFPLMLAGMLAIGLQPWVPFKILIVACSTAAIALSFFWLRRKRRPELAFTIALLMAVSPGVIGLSHWELSDVPFWAFTAAALFAWERIPPHNTPRLLAATALTILAYFTRSAGLPLIVAAGAWLLWRRRWKQLAIFAAGVAPFVLWWWWRARTQGGVDYVQQFWFVNPYAPEQGRVGAIDLIRRALENGTAYFNRHLPLLLVGASHALGMVISYIVGVLALIGWTRRLKHTQIAELFFPLYIGLLLVWPAVWSGERFLVPALPLILFYSADALLRFTRGLRPGLMRPASLAAAAALVIIALPPLSVSVRWGMMCTREYVAGDRYACHDAEWHDFFHTAELAGRVLPQDAVVLSRKPRLFWALSGGVPGRIYPLRSEPDSLFALAQRSRARYVVLDRVDGLSPRYLFPVVANQPTAFCVLYALGPERAAILGIKPQADERPVPGTTDQGVQFDVCGPEYWRSPAVMDSVLGRVRP